MFNRQDQLLCIYFAIILIEMNDSRVGFTFFILLLQDV